MSRRRLHRPPARQLPPGPAARLALGRVYLPLEDLRRFGVTDAELAGPSRTGWSLPCCRFEGERARGLLRAQACRSAARSAAGPGGRSRSSPAAGSPRSTRSSGRGWDVFAGRPAPTPADVRAARRCGSSCADDASRRPTPSALRITRREARNFAWGIMLLPRPKRRALAALYAFARRVDDIADGRARRRARARRAGGARRGACRASAATATRCSSRSPTRSTRYPIPRSALHDLVDGALRDVRPHPLRDWEELARVLPPGRRRRRGRLHRRLRPSDPERARPLAETLGLALQQINIMRDVPEDWELGRVYLPAGRARSFGVAEDDIAAGRDGPGWRALMAHQAARARGAAARGPRSSSPLLDGRSALCVRTLRRASTRPARRRSGARATTSSGERPQLSARRQAARSARSRGGRCEGGGRRRWARRARRGARPRRRRARRDAARGAADARRRRADAARARGRPVSAARQRPARRARLLLPSTCASSSGSGRRARSARCGSRCP